MKPIFIFILFVLVPCEKMFSQTVSVSNNWYLSLSNYDIERAGGDFGDQLSSPSQLELSVYSNVWSELVGYDWKVFVSKSEKKWDPDLILLIRRTNDGYPMSEHSRINDGTYFIPITATETEFFNGYRGRLDIELQLQLKGVSVLIPVGNYSTQILFTITAN